MGHGISPAADTAVILMPGLRLYVRYRPKADEASSEVWDDAFDKVVEQYVYIVLIPSI